MDNKNGSLVLVVITKYYCRGIIPLCPSIMPFNYALQLCPSIMPFNYALQLCPSIMPFNTRV
jgi:hypothetical protein